VNYWHAHFAEPQQRLAFLAAVMSVVAITTRSRLRALDALHGCRSEAGTTMAAGAKSLANLQLSELRMRGIVARPTNSQTGVRDGVEDD
jgi:hypothetical protein